MAAQIQTMSAPLTLRQESSGSIITQITRVFIQPRSFFRAMPLSRSWLAVALLVLVITGFTATSQSQSSSSSSTSTTTSAQTSGFSLSTLSESATPTDSSTTAATQTSSSTASTTTGNTPLMTALLAASSAVVMWAGESIVLALVTMLRGYKPQLGKNLQIAVWASLPLALMLVLRMIHFSTGGTGGTLGLSLLLSQWSGYSALPELAQNVLAVLMSNLTLFWLWSLLLLYFGARYALGGKRWAVAIVIALWIIAASVVPALTSEPQTSISAMQSTGTTQTQSATTQSSSGATGTTTTQQQQNFGTNSGTFQGGTPPTGGPQGGAPPGG